MSITTSNINYWLITVKGGREGGRGRSRGRREGREGGGGGREKGRKGGRDGGRDRGKEPNNIFSRFIFSRVERGKIARKEKN